MKLRIENHSHKLVEIEPGQKLGQAYPLSPTDAIEIGEVHQRKGPNGSNQDRRKVMEELKLNPRDYQKTIFELLYKSRQ